MNDHHQILRDYERNGVVRIRKFFDAETVAEIRAELDRYIRDDLPAKPADACTLEAEVDAIVKKLDSSKLPIDMRKNATSETSVEVPSRLADLF